MGTVVPGTFGGVSCVNDELADCQAQLPPSAGCLEESLLGEESRAEMLLHVEHKGDWQEIRAVNFNEKGFDIFSDVERFQTKLNIRRGLTHFTGRVAWAVCGRPEDPTTLNKILDAIIDYQVGKCVIDEDINRINALLALIPYSEDWEKKLDVLNRNGVPVTSSINQYHVEVQSQEWTRMVEEKFGKMFPDPLCLQLLRTSCNV